MGQGFSKVSKELSFIINASLRSAKVKRLVLEEPHVEYSSRPVLHVLLRAPVGQAKSTIMSQIGAAVNSKVITEVSRAGLVGSLDGKTMQIIHGAAWECRNNLLLLDEFTFGKKQEGWEVFLQLLEAQMWSKRIGIYSSDSETVDGDLYYNVKKGAIDVKTRFACIIATMKDFRFYRGQNFRALVTRCVPYNFDLTEEDISRILNGELLFKLDKKIEKEPFVDEVRIDQQKYLKIKRYVMNKLKVECKDENTRKEIIMRTVGDCCRFYAATGNNTTRHFRDIIQWKSKTHGMIGQFYGQGEE